jgi:hypothetical protein
MVRQSGRKHSKKPTPDRLNYGQFYEASARILRDQLTPSEEIQYLDYMRQIGVLLQTFTCSSVFTLDHLHRLHIHSNGGIWNKIENTLENSTLKRRTIIIASPLPAMELAKSRTPVKQHVRTHQRRHDKKLYLLMLTVGVIICTKDARMATNATTRMYAAWTDAAGSTPPTSTHKPQVAPLPWGRGW